MEISKNVEPRMRSVQQLAAQFDSPPPVLKDPASMTMSERKALFERNEDQAPCGKFRTPQTSRGFTPKRPNNMDNKKNRNIGSGMKEELRPSSSPASSGKLAKLDFHC